MCNYTHLDQMSRRWGRVEGCGGLGVFDSSKVRGSRVETFSIAVYLLFLSLRRFVQL